MKKKMKKRDKNKKEQYQYFWNVKKNCVSIWVEVEYIIV